MSDEDAFPGPAGPPGRVRTVPPGRTGRPRTRHAVPVGIFPVRDTAPVEVIEGGPGLAARAVSRVSRLTLKPALTVGSVVAQQSGNRGAGAVVARAVVAGQAVARTTRPEATVALPHARAELICADRVRPADGTGPVVLYLPGGGFVSGATNAHRRLVATLSRFAGAPVLLVHYALLPRHSIGMAVRDCEHGYRWLRGRGYAPGQIVLAGDSVGGYLALTLAQRLQAVGEKPAALVAISPLLQLAPEPRRAHPNSRTDAMFPAAAFTALTRLIAGAAAAGEPAGEPEPPEEPLTRVRPGLPRTLIHVSGSEVLLHDTRLAARTLAAAGVAVDVRIWPGQLHDFPLAAPMLPEATRALRQIGAYIRRATGSAH